MKKLLIGIGVAVMLVGCGSDPVEEAPVEEVPTTEKSEKRAKAESGCARVGGTLVDFQRDDGSTYSMCTMQ